jgi:HD superfamily phosphodiesterase
MEEDPREQSEESFEKSIWGEKGPPSFGEESEEERQVKEEKRIKEQEFLEEEEGVSEIEPAEHPNKIEREDIKSAWEFLRNEYKTELENKGEVTAEMVGANIAHAERVAKNAKWIAKGEWLDEAKLEFAGICHDSAKLDYSLPGGVDTFNHHETSAGTTRVFLYKMGKSDELAESISDMIKCHSFIPFIIAGNPRVPEPKTKYELALRDADILDQIDIWGLKKIIEIRQNPNSEFYKEDKGDFQKALASALETRKHAVELLVMPTAKKIAEGYVKRSEKLLALLKERNVKTFEEFETTFEDFIK